MKKNKIAAMAVTTILALSMMLSACGSKGDAESSKIDTESSVTAEESSKAKDESSKTTAKDESSKTSSKDESSKASSKAESSKTTSTESSKTTSSESSKTNNESSKPTQGGNAGNSGNTGSTDSKPTSGGSTGGGSTGGSTTQGCSHNWVPQTTTVHHDAATHTEQVQTGTKTVEDAPAWDENVEVDSTPYVEFGNGTQWDVPAEGWTDDFYDEIAHYCATNGVGYAIRTRPIYETVHHEAITHEEPVYENKTVTDKAAYDEEVVTGYKCSKCGATK